MSNEFPRVRQENIRREFELKAAEEAEQTRIEQARAQDRQRAEESGNALAGDMLAGMRPMYLARAKKAAELAPLLAEFWAIEADIRRQEGQAYKALADTQRYNDSNPQSRLESLRSMAGLPDRTEVNLPTPNTPGEALARTVFAAITGGNLAPGAITLAGGRGVVFDFKKD